MLINDYLSEMENSKLEEITLRGPGRPPGLLKTLLSNYNEELDELRQASGLHSIVIDYRR